MVEEDRGEIIATSQLAKPATSPDRDSIVKLTENGTVENVTEEVTLVQEMLHMDNIVL